MSVSQAEIWDDSALIESWNEAVEEYKKYHSIKENRGIFTEKVKSIEGSPTRSYEMSSNRCDEDPSPALCNRKPSVEAEILDDLQNQSIPRESLPEKLDTTSSLPLNPQNLIGQVEDEGLKNLLMSWYYAGYYTGLYEGQHQK